VVWQQLGRKSDGDDTSSGRHRLTDQNVRTGVRRRVDAQDGAPIRNR
jgi:hypothetical protein